MTDDGPDPDDDEEEPTAEDGSSPVGDDSVSVDEGSGRGEPTAGDQPTSVDRPAGSTDSADSDAEADRERRSEAAGTGPEGEQESIPPSADQSERDRSPSERGRSVQDATSGPDEGGDAATAEVAAAAEADDGAPEDATDADAPPGADDEIPEDVRSYDRFQKMDRAGYDRVNEFLRDRTYITAREWAIARLCADFRTATGVEMTKIGEHLPELVPFMTDTYSPQAVNQARSAFEDKVRMAGATFLYGAMSGFFTADELDDLMYEVTEVAKFLLEVEGVELAVEEELAAEDRISSVMREVREASEQLRYDDVECPECGHHIQHPEAEPE